MSEREKDEKERGLDHATRNCSMKEEEEEENGADSNSGRRAVLSFLNCLNNWHSMTMKRYLLWRGSEGDTFSSFIGEAAEKSCL